MIITEEEFNKNYLEHYGTPRRSGRYPWGSGGHIDTSPRNPSFADIVTDLRKQGLTDPEICVGLGIGTTDRNGKFRPSTTQLRAKYSISKNEQKQANITQAARLREKGYSYQAIADRMNLAGESSVRALLEPGVKDRADILTSTAEMLKREVGEKGMIQVGSGVENQLGLSQTKLNTAVEILKQQGYAVHTIKEPQIGTVFETQIKVLAPPGTTWADVARNRDQIRLIREFSDDGGRNFKKFQPPIPVDPKRVDIIYKEDGGDKADGVIYVRRGVEDISLGASNYAQVRIQIGDGHYLKGMAMYKDDLPKGVDLVFNTNKPRTPDKLSVMKKLEDDPDLPFGSIVDQITNDKGQVTSAMNKVNEEGKWAEWSKSLSPQMLSKQAPRLAKEQLDVTFERRQKELQEIMSLTNPTVRRKFLETFADTTDSAAVHMKAAHMPRQTTRVILPLNSLSDSQVYAPGFKNGETVVLIRYPHAGTFEIPELRVNNKNVEGVKLLGDAQDALGINHKVAQRLSGADFDGDTVLVIPNNQRKIKSSPALEGLKNFDPQVYKLPDDAPEMTERTKGIEMGKVSNLITDMTIRGAPHSEIVRAVKHSMVVIDAKKHHLNYKQSERDNNIKDLRERYQGSQKGGASTLISRAGKEVRIPDRKLRSQSEGGHIDPTTGKLVFVETGKKDWKGRDKTIKKEMLALTDDAFTLTSGPPPTQMERLYANHSNKLKSMANQARLASIKTPPLKYMPSAAKVYSKEVSSLDSKLNLALQNAPLEKQAQLIANAQVKLKRAANPNLEKDTIKKIKFQALEEARIRTGAKKQKIRITEEEWNAIQAGAISNNKLSKILTNADLDVVRQYATPRVAPKMSTAMTQRAQSMRAAGYTRSEIAEQLGVSVTTLDTALKGEGE